MQSDVEDSLSSEWINWCRLCAKEDKLNNINFLYRNDEHLANGNKKLSLQEALAKYFWVQATFDDPLPKMLCSNCLSLVSAIINFNERVERVQLMYLYLVEAHNKSEYYDLNSIRLKYDLTDTEKDHWHFKTPLNDSLDCKDNSLNKLNLKESSLESASESKFNVHIKQENGENSVEMSYDRYMEEDSDIEQEQMLYEENINDLYAEEDEDPFEANEKVSTTSEQDLITQQDEIISKESEPTNLKLDRCKKKLKRKKLKLFSKIECSKKKKDLKDFEIETTCKECGDKFSQYMSYREHMHQKHEQSISKKHWQCPICDRVLLSIFNLEKHIRIHESLKTKKTLKCLECDNTFATKAQQETHFKNKHNNDKPFICEECGLGLRTISNLRQHMLIHTDLAPFECEVCHKKFKNKTRLKTHMDIHSPHKHICNICGLQLNSRATLNRHFLVHSDKMQHKCDYCGKAFKRAKALKNHLLLHTGLKPYSCDFCDRTFANGSNCRSHMKKTHPEELAILEASGNKTHTKNIPKLETLKAVTKAADNLTPVVTKFSGCFAFGKKPKNLENHDPKSLQQHLQTSKKSSSSSGNNKKSATKSPSSTPLDLQHVPLAGANPTTSPCLPEAKNLETDLSTTSSTQIPNFDNIYQHLMKQNQADLHSERPLTQISSPPHHVPPGSGQHNPFFSNSHNDIMQQSLKSAQEMLNSPDSHHGSMTPLTSHDDNSNTSSIQTSFYGTMRTTLPPGSFM